MRESEKYWFTFLLLLIVAGVSKEHAALWYLLAGVNGLLSIAYKQWVEK
jgi:hypothetical protein